MSLITFSLLFYISTIHSKRFWGFHSFWNTGGHSTRPKNGNDYNYGHDVCKGNREMWEDPLKPLNKRNNIGRAIYQTKYNVIRAKNLIRYGKSYDLSIPLDENAPKFDGRYFIVRAECLSLNINSGYCQGILNTNGIDNHGTQFDYHSHIFQLKAQFNKSNIKDWVFFNNFRGDQVFENDFTKNVTGAKYIGVEHMPSLFTRAILLDIPRTKGWNVLPEKYEIGSNDIRKALWMCCYYRESDLKKGDVILIYTGWERYKRDTNRFYDTRILPVIKLEAFKDIFSKRGIMVVGADTPTIERPPWPIHQYWLVCQGGFLHEALALTQWINDARNKRRSVGYIGAYVYAPVPIKGVFGSISRPMLYY